MIRAVKYLGALAPAAAIIFGAVPLKAQTALPPLENGVFAVHAIQAGYYAPWPAACRFGSHYVCWRGTYGGRYCGCWEGGDHPACPEGYHFSCRPDALGGMYCACY